jgi:hypothetical protein
MSWMADFPVNSVVVWKVRTAYPKWGDLAVAVFHTFVPEASS